LRMENAARNVENGVTSLNHCSNNNEAPHHGCGALFVKQPVRKRVAFIAGSPCATLFITVLFLPQLSEIFEYQLVIKDRAAPDEAEAVSIQISL